MNRLLQILAIALCSTLLCACGDEPKRPNGTPALPGGGSSGGTTTENLQAQLSTSTAKWNGDKTVLSIKSSGNWAAKSAQQWCHISPASGTSSDNEAAITIDANTTPEPRSATITVKCGTITSNLSITQEPRPQVTIASRAISLAATAGKSTFILKSNVDWTIESDASWCTATPTNGKKGTTAITITAEANASKAERTAQLTITASDDKTIITVTQAAPSQAASLLRISSR